MSNLLRGNFEARNTVSVEKKPETLEDRFEQAALARLGGSIGYVSRRGFVWTGDDGQETVKPEVGRAAQYDEADK